MTALGRAITEVEEMDGVLWRAGIGDRAVRDRMIEALCTPDAIDALAIAMVDDDSGLRRMVAAVVRYRAEAERKKTCLTR